MSNVSVLLATFRRSAILEQTLSAMSRLETGGVAWELAIVDNLGEEATRKVCARFAGQLPLRDLVCTTPGKSAALNYGLRNVSGELIILTDDDVLPHADWLQEMYQGANRWPAHVLFCGRVLPHWPIEPPNFALNPHWDRWTYGVYDPGFAEGPHAAALPLGANMAVRRQVFEVVGFNEAIGPRGREYALGNELDLSLRIKSMGHAAVFLPRSLVGHIIRPEQLSQEWLIGRAFRQGRGETFREGANSWLTIARLGKQATWKTAAYYGELLRKPKPHTFQARMASSVCRGRLYEALRIKLGLR